MTQRSDNPNEIADYRLFTAGEAADWLRISTRTLYTLTAGGQLPAVRIGRSVRYRPADLAAYCERLAQEGVR